MRRAHFEGSGICRFSQSLIFRKIGCYASTSLYNGVVREPGTTFLRVFLEKVRFGSEFAGTLFSVGSGWLPEVLKENGNVASSECRGPGAIGRAEAEISRASHASQSTIYHANST